MTKEAVLKFQRVNGLTQDGIVGENTGIALDNQVWAAQQPVIREGSRGEGVKSFQEMYNNHAGRNLAVDGDFGAKTKAAVIEFQQSRGLTADGIVGRQTWTSLYSLATHDIPVTQRISSIFTELVS